MKNLLTLILALVFIGCAKEAPDHHENDHDHDENTKNVIFTSEQLEMAEIKTAKIQEQEISDEINCIGIIDLPPQNKATIHPQIQGFIKEIRVLIGTKVKKGELLVVLEHPDYIKLQEAYLEVLYQFKFAEKEFSRQKTLSEGNATAKKQFEKTESEYGLLKAKKASLEAQMKMAGLDFKNLTPEKITNQVNIYAPFSGSISNVFVQTGQHVTIEERILDMINKEHIHLELQVFPRDAVKIALGQEIKFEVQGLPERKFAGEVFLIGETVDQHNNAINIHGHIEEELDLFKPGMYVSATIKVNAQKLPVVPENALINDEGQYFVFAKTGDSEFEKMPVEIGLVNGGFVEISSGSFQMIKGMEIVTEGANYIKAQMHGISGGHDH
ncbi:efflux RND transporter periplasmic adaptor subunit [Flexithrix dorotheae]|uniref:efflux RND transporter periplasmic adaptor subunit n=1 Tax=Flexithrix dorotheae TaxID=70993 RepID=UPI00035E399F|nr:efflux RND transporter periplasmic adaptor subunit [Flexithrix dorotheae]